ncbi:hypothetical protein COPR103792_05780 [Corynebacterium propinquum]|nr:MAG: hypothetical protein DI558_09475 [Corynebacterium propinquum]
MLGLVGHLAHLPDKVGQPVNTVMLPVPDIAIRALTRVEGAAAEPVGEVRVVAQKPPRVRLVAARSAILGDLQSLSA